MKMSAAGLAVWMIPTALCAQEIAPVITVRADHVLTAKAPIVLCDASRGPVTFTLPPPEARRSFSFTVKKTDASPNECRFSGKIDGRVLAMSNQFESWSVISTRECVVYAIAPPLKIELGAVVFSAVS